jgi:uncharacterized protein with HEPN domain
MAERSLKHFYDAREAARAIRHFAAGKTFEDYCSDEMLSSAIVSGSRKLGQVEC